MRGLELLFLCGFLGMVGLGVWNVRHWLHPDGSIATATAAKPPLKGPRIAKQGSPPSKPGIRASALTVADVPFTVVTVPFVSPRFPDAKDLQAGMTSIQMLSSFGEPAARVTRPDNGELSERYFYLNKERSRVTVANLQDGIVVSAESKPFPLANHH